MPAVGANTLVLFLDERRNRSRIFNRHRLVDVHRCAPAVQAAAQIAILRLVIEAYTTLRTVHIRKQSRIFHALAGICAEIEVLRHPNLSVQVDGLVSLAVATIGHGAIFDIRIQEGIPGDIRVPLHGILPHPTLGAIDGFPGKVARSESSCRTGLRQPIGILLVVSRLPPLRPRARHVIRFGKRFRNLKDLALAARVALATPAKRVDEHLDFLHDAFRGRFVGKVINIAYIAIAIGIVGFQQLIQDGIGFQVDRPFLDKLLRDKVFRQFRKV